MIELWENYNKTRIAGDKKTANKILLQFINLLKKEDNTYIRAFADDICNKMLEADQSTLSNNGTDVSNNKDRIQHPLFKEIILPVLIEQYLNNSALHIKWIGQLEQFFFSDNTATKYFLKQINIDGDFSTSFFLEKSFDIDKRQDTLTLILKRAAEDIRYYIHTLPIAVLVEPEMFNDDVKTFKHYMDKYNDKEKWSELLLKWENIAKHWASYFSTRDDYKNFVDYQQRHDIKLP